MKLLDKIMRLFGYENIEYISISREFRKTPPSELKMRNKRIFYVRNKRLWKFLNLIVISRYNVLLDGYTSYLIAKENNIKYVKVVRV